MILYVAAIALLALQGMKLRLWSFNEDYLSKEGTDAIRGIFILLIFASHFAQYVPRPILWVDVAYARLRAALGQAVVTCFLFYSGYGVALSVDKKGMGYVRAMPRRRILSTLLTYDCAVLLYLIQQMCAGKYYSVPRVLAALMAWNGVGNSDWYIFAILCCYTVTWLVLRWRPGSGMNKGAALGITTGCLWVVLLLISSGKATWWYDTLFCYPLGVWYYLYKDKVERIMKRNTCYYPVLFLVLAAYALVHKVWEDSLFLYSLTMLLFALSVVFLTMKFELHNRFLIYCGRHLTGLYLLQRLPMNALQQYFAAWSEPFGRYVYFALCLIMTFVLEAVFYRWIKAMGIGTNKLETSLPIEKK